jgi:microcin C transport system substrate-binding protein
MAFYSAGDWARRVNGRKFKTGELVKGEFQHQLPTGFQSYVLNTRRPLQDVRVRQALGLAIDFEWMNRQMFYGAYRRVHGIFGNTACAATGLPDAAQRALMEPQRTFRPPPSAPPSSRRAPTKAPTACARTCARRSSCWRRPAGRCRTAR